MQFIKVTLLALSLGLCTQSAQAFTFSSLSASFYTYLNWGRTQIIKHHRPIIVGLTVGIAALTALLKWVNGMKSTPAITVRRSAFAKAPADRDDIVPMPSSLTESDERPYQSTLPKDWRLLTTEQIKKLNMMYTLRVAKLPAEQLEYGKAGYALEQDRKTLAQAYKMRLEKGKDKVELN